MPLELLPLDALSRETWLRKPPRSEEGPRVDGALTTQPRAPAVLPVLLDQLGQAQAVTC